MEFRCLLDGGAYGSYGAASMLYTGALQTTTYAIPAYRFEGLRAFTTKPPCGPKRGHGTPQPRFALECHLDKVGGGARARPGRAAPPQPRRAVLLDGQPPADHELRARGVHRPGRRGLRIRGEARAAAARARRRLRGQRVHVRRGAPDLRERAAAVGGADQGRPGRRRDRLLDGHRHRPGLRLGARLPDRRGARPRAGRRCRRQRRHRPDPDRPRQLLEPGHLHGRQRRGRGRGADASARARSGGRAARGCRSTGSSCAAGGRSTPAIPRAASPGSRRSGSRRRRAARS